mmetsp:Transcript_17120/g.29610  ORF Transcript_17120/g.29610 Transcript_17120/m.29610 type:complete len:369 (-) Transcript_17120:972-2078(-)|eukprot:CAMPEP_0196654634 /NCGR_PEP_ID=MMETSP1086-20130531/4364_1 /TAXON_ID=77921 /ORGANISM="Cyanoptyche  gloeocystis , Strain SAG4.97" /LENGTH=368 /DNA_ID=CAMNT_0041986509 /DNA_START=57 /DNA_END=1163 /DNA_ORIENTATION=-
METAENSMLLSLSEDIIVEILRWLPEHAKGSMAQVCKRLSALSTSKHAGWKRLSVDMNKKNSLEHWKPIKKAISRYAHGVDLELLNLEDSNIFLVHSFLKAVLRENVSVLSVDVSWSDSNRIDATDSQPTMSLTTLLQPIQSSLRTVRFGEVGARAGLSHYFHVLHLASALPNVEVHTREPFAWAHTRRFLAMPMYNIVPAEVSVFASEREAMEVVSSIIAKGVPRVHVVKSVSPGVMSLLHPCVTSLRMCLTRDHLKDLMKAADSGLVTNVRRLELVWKYGRAHDDDLLVDFVTSLKQVVAVFARVEHLTFIDPRRSFAGLEEDDVTRVGAFFCNLVQLVIPSCPARLSDALVSVNAALKRPRAVGC